VKRKLTPAFVAKAAAVPGTDRTIYWDSDPRGFGLMVTESGHRSFVVQYRAGKKSRRMAFKRGLSLEEARKEARALIGAVAKGRDPLSERRTAEMLAANALKSIAEEYLSREGKRLRSIDQRRAVFERLVYPKLGARQIGEIKRTEIVRLLDKIEDESGPAMADQVLRYLSRLFSWHAGRSDEFRSPVIRGMARTKVKERARNRVLSDDELKVVWRAAEGHQGAFGRLVRFILLTATRRNEAARMRREELSGGEWRIPANRYKGRHDHVVPLSVAARAILAKVPVIGRDKASGFIFTHDGKTPIGGFSKFKSAFDESCGVTGWTIHDLRRTARSLMSRAGVDADVAERCLGHVIPGVRGTYDRHEYREEKRRAFEALAAQIVRIVDPQDNVVALRGTY
jgi:integrase